MTKTVIENGIIPQLFKEVGTATYTVGTTAEYKNIDLGGDGLIFNVYIAVSEGGTVEYTNGGAKDFTFSIIADEVDTELTVTYTVYYTTGIQL